jgi:phosphosulfolactate phosphohydrolase-like enzyme
VRFDWGLRGAAEQAGKADVLIVVDVLSGDDVRYAIAFDVSTAVPILREGAFASLV